MLPNFPSFGPALIYLAFIVLVIVALGIVTLRVAWRNGGAAKRETSRDQEPSQQSRDKAA
jgi:hypothetical protein